MASALQLLQPLNYDGSTVTVTVAGGTIANLENVTSISDVGGFSVETTEVFALGKNTAVSFTPGIKRWKDCTMTMSAADYKKFCLAYGGESLLAAGNQFDLTVSIFHAALAPLPITAVARGCRLIDKSWSELAAGSSEPVTVTIVFKVSEWSDGGILAVLGL